MPYRRFLPEPDEAAALVEGGRLIGLDSKILQRSLPAFEKYMALLRYWGRTVNLMSRRDLYHNLVAHLLDSLAVAPLLGPRKTVMDLGSGAGLPAVPLAIYRPDLTVIAVESRRKKGAFLREVRRQLRLKNLKVYIQRWENLRDVPADVLVTRATGALTDILALAPRLLPRGGKILVYATEPDHRIPPARSHQVRNPVSRRVFYLLEYRYQPASSGP